jgi:hypothetical protein
MSVNSAVEITNKIIRKFKDIPASDTRRIVNEFTQEFKEEYKEDVLKNGHKDKTGRIDEPMYMNETSSVIAYLADKEYFFSEDYFSKIFSIDKSKWKIFIVSLNNNPIGGGIVFENSNFFNIHLTASLIDYRNFHPNEILRDFIIERFSISASKIINFLTL